MKEVTENKVTLQLPQTSLEAFKTYLYTGKLGEPLNLSDLSALLEFASMIKDQTLIELASEAVIVFLLDEKNEPLFDPAPLHEHAQEFTRRYLEKKGIQTESLERGSFSISLSSFTSLFTQEESKILDFISNKIDQIWINQRDITPLFLLPKKYRQAIISIKSGPIVDALPHEQLEKLFSHFPNIWSNPYDEEKLRKILAPEPSAFMHSLLSKLLFNQNKFAEAETVAKKAVELYPKNAQVHCELGLAMILLKKFTEAVPVLEKTIELDPKNAAAHYQLGGALHATNRYAEAEPFLRKAIELNPKNDWAHTQLGIALNKLGRHAEGESFLQKPYELNPQSAEAPGS